MRILVFGASGGLGTKDLESSGWVDRLKAHLAKESGWKIQTYNLCVSGNTSDDMLEYFEKDCETRSSEYDETVIIISVSKNDSHTNKEGKFKVSPEKFRDNMKRLVEISKKFSNKIIFITGDKVDESKTNPFLHFDYYLKNSDIEKSKTTLRNILKEKDIPFIELKDIEIDSDGLHPSTDGHKKIFKTVKDFLIDNNIVKL